MDPGIVGFSSVCIGHFYVIHVVSFKEKPAGGQAWWLERYCDAVVQGIISELSYS